MADTKTTDLTENSAPLGSDLDYMVDDPGGTPLSQKIYKGSNNLLADGFMLNGAFTVTVASNNLTVTLKTKSGGNPSTTDPVSIWMNGSFRRCTATLSVTKNAATNWFNSGSSELATLEQNYFIYAIWNTTPSTDIMDIGFARIPWGRVYSEFSGTSTNEQYLAFANASTPNAADVCVNVGRFAATLSAGAGYTWSVPSFTNANLIQFPCFESEWRSWSPTFVGFSANPTSLVHRYKLSGTDFNGDCELSIRHGANGTSNATNFTMTLPFTARTITDALWSAPAAVVDNSVVQTAAGECDIASAGTTVVVRKTYDVSAGASWTASGGKRIIACTGLRYLV